MDRKKIRRAICGAAAAVAVCFTAAGINTKPVYAADMGAVYGIFEHGVGWSAYHGDQTAERAGNGTYVTAIRASLSGQPERMSSTISAVSSHPSPIELHSERISLAYSASS